MENLNTNYTGAVPSTGPEQTNDLVSEGGTPPSQLKVPVAPPSQTIPEAGPDKGGEGGEGGKTTPFTASTPSNRAFLETIFSSLPEGARPAISAKAGDPQQGGWFAHDAEEVDDLCTADKNTYFNCASFKPTNEGLQARKEQAVAYHVLVLDDVGTKVDQSLLGDVKPTCKLETSPGNFLVGYKLESPLTDPQEVDRFQQAIAAAGLTDKGALGIARWARLPVGINGKQKHLTEGRMPFQCLLHEWNPDTSYSADDLKAKLVPEGTKLSAPTSTEQPSLAKQSDKQSFGVYRPRADENPVVTALKQRKLYKREEAPGRHAVTCPWVEEHTDQLDDGACYFEPSDDYPNGGFVCHHSHKDKYHVRELLGHLNLDLADARNRPLIQVLPGEMPAILSAAEKELAQRGDLYQSGNVIVSIKEDSLTGQVAMQAVSDPALTLALSAVADWEKYDARAGEMKRCDPPPRHVTMLYRAQHYAFLPELRGIARQPYYDESGNLITKEGYNPEAKRLGAFDATKFGNIGNKREAAEDALQTLQDLICEFHFATDVDRSAALCAMLTAAVRPALPLAPAYHVSAPSSGSGKSFLCEVISLFAGPGGSSRISYPRTSEEATKAILSVLMPNPPVVEFDDMDTDWLPHGAINRMLTAPTITDRVLGVSKVATVSTQSLILGSGNNVGPIRDTLRRVITISLNARTESPGTITYKGDPVRALKANRERYVSGALTIVEAWKAAGSRKKPVPSIASYGGAWSDLCRQPLLWLGLPDPATSLIEQMKTDPESDELPRLFQAWHKRHGEVAITIRKLLAEDLSNADLDEALRELPVVEGGRINRSKLGRYLSRNRERVIGGYILQKAENSERNAWKVVKVAKEVTPPSPASPPSAPPDAQKPDQQGEDY